MAVKVLLVVDMQHDFVDGVLGTEDAKAIVPRVAKKVAEYTEMDNSVIVYTRDTHSNDYLNTQEWQKLPVPHCIFLTRGWEIVPEVYTDINSEIFDKYTFGLNDIGEILERVAWRIYETQEIESIEIVGLHTDSCVVSNALLLKTYFSEIPIIVDSNCCAGIYPDTHLAALTTMEMCQINIII